MNQFDLSSKKDVTTTNDPTSLRKSGKFYIIIFPNGQYFKSISATGRVFRCNTFEQAAKIFDCDLQSSDEVYEMAVKLGGCVEYFGYEHMQNKIMNQAPSKKLNLEERPPAKATFYKSSWEQVEPSYIVCSACRKETPTTTPLSVCPHCLRPLFYN